MPDTTSASLRLPILLLATTLMATTLSCQADRPRTTPVSTDGGQALALIGADTVTHADLPEGIRNQLARMDAEYRRQRQDMLRSAAEQAVRLELLDREAGEDSLTREELIARETDGKIQVTDADVRQWYGENRMRLGGRSFEELGPQIEQFLRDTEQNRIMTEFLRAAEERNDVRYLVEPFRAELDNAGAPAIGPRRAPVEIVEFSDFECPYCRQFRDVVKEVSERYGDDVRIVYRQLPLNTHPNAFKAAEASLCAHEQGEFWEYHDLLFDEQDRLTVDDLKEKAERIGLKMDVFASCLDRGQFADRVRADAAEAARYGIQGTPQVFVNGLPGQSGALTVEMLSEMVDSELRRLGVD
jgi:predicted DsbA family dithiol-disulfide isomerase